MHLHALARCVGNVDLFLRDRWARAPFVLKAGSGSESGFDDLASLDDLDRMVTSLGLYGSNLRMVREGMTLPVSAYTTPPGPKSRSRDALVNASLVYRRFEEGATIVLESLHRYWRPLADFCRELEMALGHRAQVNAYITPPGSQGFDVHSDGHDVFVLQVSGTKHWTVSDRDDREQVLIDQEIERGDALYIPAGFPHAASAGDAASAHLTVGILTHDSVDLVREIAKLAEQEPVFQERLPGAATRDPRLLRETVELHLEEMKSWLDKVDVDELTQRMARKVMSSAQPVVHGLLGQMQSLHDIDADTLLARRRGAICVLFPGATSMKVLLVDRELEMPPVAEAAMGVVAERERLQARDLHAHLSPETALVLVRRLVREGLLEVVVGD